VERGTAACARTGSRFTLSAFRNHGINEAGMAAVTDRIEAVRERTDELRSFL